jgi:hypothetical protein
VASAVAAQRAGPHAGHPRESDSDWGPAERGNFGLVSTYEEAAFCRGKRKRSLASARGADEEKSAHVWMNSCTCVHRDRLALEKCHAEEFPGQARDHLRHLQLIAPHDTPGAGALQDDDTYVAPRVQNPHPLAASTRVVPFFAEVSCHSGRTGNSFL